MTSFVCSLNVTVFGRNLCKECEQMVPWVGRIAGVLHLQGDDERGSHFPAEDAPRLLYILSGYVVAADVDLVARS